MRNYLVGLLFVAYLVSGSILSSAEAPGTVSLGVWRPDAAAAQSRPVLVAAEMEGMDMQEGAAAEEPPPIPAGRPTDPGYTPVEKPADDTSMALVVAAVFGLPVGLWLAARHMKKSRRAKK